MAAFSTPAKEGQSISLRDLRVTELVMDKVTEADLSIAIAAGTTVFREDMPIGSKEYFTTRQDEHIAPSDIPRIETMLREGTSAERQLKVFQETGDLRAVVQHVVAETRAGVADPRPSSARAMS